jgi:hypothetical protein
MTRKDRYPNSGHGRPDLWACFAPAASGRRRSETRRNASKRCVDSGWQLSEADRA